METVDFTERSFAGDGVPDECVLPGSAFAVTDAADGRCAEFTGDRGTVNRYLMEQFFAEQSRIFGREKLCEHPFPVFLMLRKHVGVGNELECELPLINLRADIKSNKVFTFFELDCSDVVIGGYPGENIASGFGGQNFFTVDKTGEVPIDTDADIAFALLLGVDGGKCDGTEFASLGDFAGDL